MTSKRRLVRVVLLGGIAALAGLTFTGIEIPYLSSLSKPDDPKFGDDGRDRYNQLPAHHYLMDVTWIDAPNDPGPGGTMIALGDNLLVMTRTGGFFGYSDGATAFGSLDLPPPFSVPNETALFEKPLNFSAIGGRGLALIETAAGDLMLYAAHTLSHPDRACTGVAVSGIPVTMDERALPSADGSWRVIYETSPCQDGGDALEVLQAGGMLHATDDDQLLLAVGDYELDGTGEDLDTLPPQDPGSDLGKLLRIDPETGSAQHVSSGHRNASGLTVARDGTIWMVEHGPRGGDELNLIEDGANYGWPLVTYGVQYGTVSWPHETVPAGRHDGYREPVYAWLPSPALSGIAEITGSEFPNWEGDLIVGSMVDQALYRVRLAPGPG